MNKATKKKIKNIIAGVLAVAVALFLAAMPLLADQEPQDEGPQASILSGKVAGGTIPTKLLGGGSLAEEDAVTLSIPAEVKLTEFLVSNGDFVTEGTPMASVDRVTVMNAITQVQETLEYLSERIEEAADTDSQENITALAGGTVKLLYAQAGDNVQDVMLQYGALAVLSLDGLMAVDLETDAALAAGSAVTVVLADGQEFAGKVASNLAGQMTVTLADQDFEVDQVATVLDGEGNELGQGALYIYSPWNATAYTGSVKTVKVSVGDALDPGDKLLVLENVGHSAAYRQLVSQRQEYEALMLDLFKLYQTQTVTAPCDGVVSGIDKNSLQLLSQEGGFRLQLLANAPNGDDETLYMNYVGKVTAVATNGWMIDANPTQIPIADYMELSGVSLDETLMTHTVLHTQTQIPIFMLREGAWVQVPMEQIQKGDILLFASDGQGNPVWSVLVKQAEQTPAGPGSGTTLPGTGTGGIGSFGGFGGFGGFSGMGGMTQQEPAFEVYGLDMAQIASVTPQDTVTLEIAVDEMDITALTLGMEAQIRIDALGGQKYTAFITEIGNTGSSHGGNSKFTVELTLERAENMLAGMTASASILLAETQQVLTVPAEALVEVGNKTLVYTGYDEKNQVLVDPVEVKVGSSDGRTVQILEGLAHGQTYYYAYYDTLQISYTPDFGGFSFG